MNLPSSLALPQSKFFQSRIGILILALVLALAGTGVYFALRATAPSQAPTPATSPAAQAPVTAAPVAKAPGPVVYGPPAPEWVERVAIPPAGPAAATSAAPGAAAPAVPVPVAVPGAPPAVPVGGSAAHASGSAVETPQSLDASVLFARDQYAYTSGGRRDPFQSLIDGKFQGHSGDGSLVDVGDIHLVGIMWGSADKFALIEDSRGRGFVLRVGDPVVNGYISGISRTELQIVQNAFGESQTLAIKLQPKEGDQNATRN